MPACSGLLLHRDVRYLKTKFEIKPRSGPLTRTGRKNVLFVQKYPRCQALKYLGPHKDRRQMLTDDRRQRKRGTETVNTGVQAAGDTSWHTHTLRVQTHTMYAGPTQITHIKAGRITLKHHTHTHTLSLNNTFLLFL